LEPTYRDIARLTGALSQRRANLRRLIHSLQLLNTELANSGQDVSELVDESAVVFRAFAAEQANVRASLRELPPSLRQVSLTLGKTERFANVLRPTADRLRPAVRAITPANRAARALAVEANPIVRDQIRPFVREVRPLVTDLGPAAQRLADATPHLTDSFVMLNKLFNLIGYNPGGREGVGERRDGSDEGWLFWIAWVTHQTEHLFTINDANGSYRPVFIGGTCGIWEGVVEQAIEESGPAGGFFALFGLNLQQILNNACPTELP
jgi:phospholipid/cholesterol/gamma-HCH transport system substrate-binding protein